MRNKAKKYYCDVFTQEFVFCIGWKSQDYENFMHKTYGTRGYSKQRIGVTVHLVADNGASIIVVWTKNKRDYNTLTHEAVHAANFTLQRVGVKASFKNDEAQAYLVGLLVEKALG